METNIESLLDLDLKLLGDSSGNALRVLDEVWQAQGKPTEAGRLGYVLKLTLDKCVRLGITYPKIFLKRKGELARGDFRPEMPMTPGAPVQFSPPQHPKVPADWLKQATEEFNASLTVSTICKRLQELNDK